MGRVLSSNKAVIVKKRILITGGAGFIGSHLCDRLVAAGHEVLCVDNYFTGSKSNVFGLMDAENFELMRHDITFPLYVEVDEIFNLACPASPLHYQHDPVQTTKTSVHGAINMLGLAKGRVLKFSKRPPAKCMATLRFIHKRKIIGATSIQLVPGAATTRANAVPRRYFSIFIASTA